MRAWVWVIARSETKPSERLLQLEAAARLAERLARPKEAAELWLKACRFEQSAALFLRAGEPDKALLMAARVDNAQLTERCIGALVQLPTAAKACVIRLRAAKMHRLAASLEAALGNSREAAILYEQAGVFVRAAALYQSARDSASAARCLESEIGRDGEDHMLARLALAALLEQGGKLQAAAKLLQQIPEGDALLPAALTRLARVLSTMALHSGAAETRQRLARLGQLPPMPVEALRPFEPIFESGARSPSKASELLFGRYEVIEKVANTATARVYHALDRVLQRTVAVKVFSPSLVSGTGRDAFYRFEREVRVLSQLAHPAVVPLMAYHPEGPAQVLSWMAGGNLTVRLEQAPMSPRAGALVAARVLSALNAAHRRGILHRDIKPDNILFDTNGLCYLSDFGTAHVADHARTVTRGVLGTLAYMAPAQRRGQAATIRSDVYSVGALFWHILTGAPPDQEHPFLCDSLSRQQQLTARHLLDTEAGPSSAADAAKLIDALQWPNSVDREPQRSHRRVTVRKREERLLYRGDSAIDTLLQRPVLVMPARGDRMARARHFVAADHPALASVLLFDPKKEELWLEMLPVEPQRQLSPDNLDALTRALIRLHEVGGYHGSVDRSHVGLRGDEVALLFPKVTRSATLQQDLAKLGELR